MKEEDFFQIKVSKKYALKAVVLVTILIIFLSTCAAKGEEDPVSQNIDPRCPTGYKTLNVPNDREQYGLHTYTLTPNEGCNLSPKFCVSNRVGSLSCFVEP